MWQIWIDTGGTFTDCIAFTPNNEKKRLKILSNGVLKGRVVKQVSKAQFRVEFNWPIDTDIFNGYQFNILNNNSSQQVESIDFDKRLITLQSRFEQTLNADHTYDFEITANEEVPVLACRLATKTRLKDSLPSIDLRLGTTKGTNALLERKGAKVAFLVTKGFKDLVKIGTQQRPNIFELNIQTPPELYEQVIEIDERIASDGTVLQPLNLDSLKEQINGLIKENYSVAIALLNSYKNNSHELELSKFLSKSGIKNISCSSELSSAIKILPRAETAIVNAYLDPIMSKYINGIALKLAQSNLRVMSSGGAVIPSNNFYPKDCLLSGPAGGIIGAADIANKSDVNEIVTFDMGGTSTDVAVYKNGVNYVYETKVGDATIQSPAIDISTIAAGGGSICSYENGMLTVGPHSAGAHPGPACYGNNGPLTITDINLLAGRISEHNFSIPLDRSKSEEVLQLLLDKINEHSKTKTTVTQLINSFLKIANEKMAEAIRKVSMKKGYNISAMALVSFGGAGGQHACDLAETLNIKKVIIPYDAGLLSAYGIGVADIDIIEQQQVLEEFELFKFNIETAFIDLKENACQRFISQGFDRQLVTLKHRFCHLRLKGQETTIEVEFENIEQVVKNFKQAYISLYGQWIYNRSIEIESIKLVASVVRGKDTSSHQLASQYSPAHQSTQNGLIEDSYQEVPVFEWEQLKTGAKIIGPAVISSQNCTVSLKNNWTFNLDNNENAIIQRQSQTRTENQSFSAAAELALYQNRFAAVVEQMGAILERTSFSVNVKERLDFSCALLDANGELIVNAPHIPVHLGSLGVCVREVVSKIPLNNGDVAITNHPAYGGSHLPDVTLISPIYFDNQLVGYVANRAHHAEIGGKTPGSMPTDATNLKEEGVIIEPTLLIKEGASNFQAIENLFQNADYPTRSLQENIADLYGALASINCGIEGIKNLCSAHGFEVVKTQMSALKVNASNLLTHKLKSMAIVNQSAEEYLDDGSKLKVRINHENEILTFDFNGTSEVHKNNLNANCSIVQSVILYVLRLLVDDDIPLNEGLMQNVNIILPTCLLNPDFTKTALPAVVGGNTEVSQRLTDTLLKCLDLAACSQGTMNNLLFGNSKFGYYETICGGTGAGQDFDGHDAIHQHMTNTKITDPEILEFRYPIRLDNFSVRKNSGGNGQFKGGDGISRTFTFLDNLTLTVLTQHRTESPYGLKGGGSGKTGRQFVVKKNATKVDLNYADQVNVQHGDQFTIETPGGGGYGSAD
ncbi:hydantoinase B/oxoprolinase family protein [Fulvivirga lutimaris]|uniref:hydantoinase B/oxoprolinase family protein n=1 Tax=Fulvivirga lutimaris TaxID=1819566 RepID=UPI0012BBB7F4|nr:hydantoinase B/oxoprolinase family protein [Fulvivirga lutimaris]MTI41304.1 5-oxoprolinase [Fulvivirga lutimaris]